MKRILLIDNYDSFTWNLWHAMASIPDTLVKVVYNNIPHLEEEAEASDKIVFSPGPGLPEEAGLMMSILGRYAGKKPMLGVCLGHQAMAIHYGAKLRNLEMPLHGLQRSCRIKVQDALFKNLPEKFLTAHYHSWVVSEDDFPEQLQVTACAESGEIMAIRHTRHPSFGVQFHPESVMTPEGGQIIKNFLDL